MPVKDSLVLQHEMGMGNMGRRRLLHQPVYIPVDPFLKLVLVPCDVTEIPVPLQPHLADGHIIKGLIRIDQLQPSPGRYILIGRQHILMPELGPSFLKGKTMQLPGQLLQKLPVRAPRLDHFKIFRFWHNDIHVPQRFLPVLPPRRPGVRATGYRLPPPRAQPVERSSDLRFSFHFI